MFYQIFLSPPVKRLAIITYKRGIYELPYQQKTHEKQKLDSSSSGPFHMKTKVSLKYFANDCRLKSISKKSIHEILQMGAFVL